MFCIMRLPSIEKLDGLGSRPRCDEICLTAGSVYTLDVDSPANSRLRPNMYYKLSSRRY
jgi:hypothetical protein